MALASVLLVEDDVFTRSTLAAALSGANFEIKGEVSSAKEALAAIQKYSIDIAIIDLDLGPGANGIDIAYALRQVHSQIGIIILTSYSDPRIANPDSLPLPKGSKYITKSKLTDIRPLTKTIIELKHLPISGRTSSETEKTVFTENQIIVLQSVAEGLTTKEIAKKLKVSDKAVEGTISRLHALLHLPKDSTLNSRVQLARAYFELAGKKPPGV
jgi:DNA-binding NarL/FixJ family response regulator